MDVARLILLMETFIKANISMINVMDMVITFGKMVEPTLANLNKINDKDGDCIDGPMAHGIEENLSKDNDMEKENINLPMAVLTKEKYVFLYSSVLMIAPVP